MTCANCATSSLMTSGVASLGALNVSLYPFSKSGVLGQKRRGRHLKSMRTFKITKEDREVLLFQRRVEEYQDRVTSAGPCQRKAGQCQDWQQQLAEKTHGLQFLEDHIRGGNADAYNGTYRA